MTQRVTGTAASDPAAGAWQPGHGRSGPAHPQTAAARGLSPTQIGLVVAVAWALPLLGVAAARRGAAPG